MVDDDHARAQIARDLADERVELGSPVEAARSARGHELRTVGGLCAHLAVDAVLRRERERHGERHDHEHEHVGEGHEQTAAVGHQARSSGDAKRKPTPRTVCR